MQQGPLPLAVLLEPSPRIDQGKAVSVELLDFLLLRRDTMGRRSEPSYLVTMWAGLGWLASWGLTIWSSMEGLIDAWVSDGLARIR